MCAFSTLPHMLGHHARVAFEPAELICERAVGVMFEIAGEGCDRAIDADVLVDLALATKAAASAVEQAQYTVGVGVAMAQEGAEILGRARAAIARGVGKVAGLACKDGIAQS